MYGVLSGAHSFSVKALLYELFFLQHYEGVQFWCIPNIIGIYIFLPFVAMALKHIRLKDLRIPAAACLIYLFLLPSAIIVHCAFTGNNPDINTNAYLNLSFSGGIYGILVIMGYFSKTNPSKIKRSGWLVISVLSFLLLVAYQYVILTIGRRHGYDGGFVWYDNIILVLLSFSVFQFFLPMRRVRGSRCFKWISEASFGIYLAHNLFIGLFNNIITINSHLIKTGILFAIAFGLSSFLVWILGINKRVGRILVYTR